MSPSISKGSFFVAMGPSIFKGSFFGSHGPSIFKGSFFGSHGSVTDPLLVAISKEFNLDKWYQTGSFDQIRVNLPTTVRSEKVGNRGTWPFCCLGGPFWDHFPLSTPSKKLPTKVPLKSKRGPCLECGCKGVSYNSPDKIFHLPIEKHLFS